MNKIIIKALAAAALAAASIIPAGCTTGSQTDQVSINRAVAIMIVEANVPSSVISGVSVQTLWDQSKWTVHFELSTTVTKSELGWPESPNNRFVNQGLLPVDTYDLLTFAIDRKTGVVLSRQASDSVLLGGPGMFNTEPPGRASLPLWTAIAIGIGGLVIGGMTVWLIMHRRVKV